MKKRGMAAAGLAALIMTGTMLTALAAEPVERNSLFTTFADMQEKTGGVDVEDWSARYLTEVERYYWNFSAPGEQEQHVITDNMMSSAYQNLEMFLDNGYTLDYWRLKEYCEDYRRRKDEKAREEGGRAGEADAFYQILLECLNNPYLLNKPEASVTAVTYNGRDYSAVFDAQYYYAHNPDLQESIGHEPAELLRHFVECGIAQGRQGNEAFDVKAYALLTDAQMAIENPQPVQPGQPEPLYKYSYSFANYYGKYLGHYDYSDLYESLLREGQSPEDMAAASTAEEEADW